MLKFLKLFFWRYFLSGNRLQPQVKRRVRLAYLKNYYLSFLVEDPVDGTVFDVEVLNLIDALQRKHAE